MKCFLSVRILFAFYFAGVIFGSTQPVFADIWKPSDIVIVISMDGMRYDYPDKAEFPGFIRMEREGLRAQRMLPTFPSNTFPSHVSLATGTTPENHGIIDNSFYDKKLRKSFDKYAASQWLEAEPIWITAERQGKRSAIYYWLGSEGAWGGISASYNKIPFEKTASEQEKVNQIVQWMDLPTEKRPSLIMSYWHGADSEGHLFGPNHFMVTKKIAIQDYYLQKLQQAIDDRGAWQNVTLIVVSDHGMTDKGQAINVNDLLSKGMIDAYFQMSNAVVHLNLKKARDIKKAYDFLNKQKGFKVYYSNSMPSAISINHSSRSGNLVLVVDKGYYFSKDGFIRKNMPSLIKGGMHGLPAAHFDMSAIFFAQGKGIKKASSLTHVNMIDVAPSVAKLLNIAAPLQSKGRAFLPNLGVSN